MRLHLDLFNVYGRTNPRGYDYRVSSGDGTIIERVPDGQLPFLPSVGVSWTF